MREKSGIFDRLDKLTTIVAFGVTGLFFLWGLSFGESLGSLMQGTLNLMTHSFGWVLLFFGIALTGMSIWLAFGPYSHIKIGPDDSKPEFSTFSWFAMLFAAAYGVGLTYWGAAEPLSFYVSPPIGLPPESTSSAEMGMAWAFSHWGIVPWAIFLCYTVAIGYFVYRKGRPLRYSSALPDSLRLAWGGKVAKIVDGLMVAAMVLSVMTAIGFGVKQLAAGLGNQFGVQVSVALYLIIALVWILIYSWSAVSGIYKGIRVLSGLNIHLAIILLIFVFIFGPTTFITNIFTSSMGDYLDRFFKMSLWTDPIEQGGFPQGWTIFYWAWWTACIPAISAFATRVSYGRTFRELVMAFMILATISTWLWFGTFGGTALWMEIKGGVDIVAAMKAGGTDVVVYKLLNNLPLAFLTIPLFIILVVIFLSTTADSISYNCATICTGEKGDSQNPSKPLRAVWAVILGSGAITLIIQGEGISAIQMSSVAASSYCVIIYVIAMWYLVDDLKKNEKTRFKLNELPISDGSLDKPANKPAI
ncbi:MAG: BCCT family transporter [Deltaproteobacteria bacterium]|jgi:choline/carnitine/betaine transport|nr:BCCT family transporter [Deltaproteobacteria bacterium]